MNLKSKILIASITIILIVGFVVYGVFKSSNQPQLDPGIDDLPTVAEEDQENKSSELLEEEEDKTQKVEKDGDDQKKRRFS